jgi:hypothetical protein
MTAARRTSRGRTVAERPAGPAMGLASWWNPLIRVVASVAAAVVIAIGAIALLRIDWGDAGLDAVPVSVAGLAFSPLMAITTLAVGVVALLAAVSPDRGSKLFVGVLLIVAGIVVLIADIAPAGRWAIEDGHGWLAIVIGGVLVAAGVLLRPTVVEPLDDPLV